MASTPEENAALIREFLTSVIAGGDTDALGIFLSEESADRHPGIDHMVDSESIGATYWNTLAAADLELSIDDIVATDEQAAVRGTVTGVHRESVLGEVPTESSFDIAIVWFCRIQNGRILDTWSLPSGSWLIRQLDAPLEAHEPISSHQTEQQNHET
jgi:predicted ester cyclase